MTKESEERIKKLKSGRSSGVERNLAKVVQQSFLFLFA
jgi:hypothetical protein